ncbi:MAG: hypothetical protein WA496_04845, partial [Candidatus Udaeobacter sp.]
MGTDKEKTKGGFFFVFWLFLSVKSVSSVVDFLSSFSLIHHGAHFLYVAERVGIPGHQSFHLGLADKDDHGLHGAYSAEAAGAAKAGWVRIKRRPREGFCLVFP